LMRKYCSIIGVREVSLAMSEPSLYPPPLRFATSFLTAGMRLFGV